MKQKSPLSPKKPKSSTPSRKPSNEAPTPAEKECIIGGFTVHITRSTRRHRTVSARLVNWRLVKVRAPAQIAQDELDTIIKHLIDGIKTRQSRQRAVSSDEALQKRSNEINQRYFQSKLSWRSITYVSNQQQRYGSCTPHQGTIRISDRLKRVPTWVLDYVLVHELAHLQEPGHTTAFWNLVNRYEKTERARGYLMGMQLLDEEDINTAPEGDECA
jgi:hypothetical protein